MPEINMCNLCALVTSGSGAIGRIIAESLAAFAATVDTT
jgi:NAD(P)-dependent dehydrogenase (short-subunit alcohol dehydrogenase family)